MAPDSPANDSSIRESPANVSLSECSPATAPHHPIRPNTLALIPSWGPGNDKDRRETEATLPLSDTRGKEGRRERHKKAGEKEDEEEVEQEVPSMVKEILTEAPLPFVTPTHWPRKYTDPREKRSAEDYQIMDEELKNRTLFGEDNKQRLKYERENFYKRGPKHGFSLRDKCLLLDNLGEEYAKSSCIYT